MKKTFPSMFDLCTYSQELQQKTLEVHKNKSPLNYQQIPLPCLRNQTKARQKLNENNREKSKSRKVNRNSAGLCTF